jgi:hypothetical protein
MPTAPDIPRLLMKLLAELMERAQGVFWDTSIISTDGVLLATTAADTSQIERVAEKMAAMTVLNESMCQAGERGPAESWYLRVHDPNPKENVLGWMIYTRKWGSLAASVAGPNRLSDFAVLIYNQVMPRVLAYIDQLFETQQEPPSVWATRVVTDRDDHNPDEPGPIVLRRRKSPDEE